MKNKVDKLRKEQESLRKRLSEIREELQLLEFEDLNLPGKYLHNEMTDIYIHVQKAWIIGYGEGKSISMEGESICYSTSDIYMDSCYFHWEKKDHITTKFLNGSEGFREEWKEITEEEWKETKSKALEIFLKDYNSL